MDVVHRLVPKRITAQITVIVAVSVLLGVAVLASILVVVIGPPPDDRREALAHVFEVTRLAQNAQTAAELNVIVAAAQRADPRIARIAIGALSPVADRSAVSRSAMREWADHPEIELVADRRDPARPDSQIITRLNQSEALVFDIDARSRLWPILLGPAALTAIIIVISTVLLSVYAVRWVVAPLAAVADAAVAFGRRPQESEALARTGPYEIIQVTDALNEMRSRIRTLLDDRTRMLAAISHDLRTPLTRLRLRTERVTNAELQGAMLGDIVTISRMLDETLDYLRDDSHTEAPARIDLPSLLKTICFDFVDMGHEVAYDGPSRLSYTCRPRALSRAVTNIVENAVKFADHVTVSLAEDGGGRIVIAVADDGPGIAEAIRERVFDPFFKADVARNSNGKGFGLGLSIAREIIQRHGGSIGMEPLSPTGLRVVMTMPAVAAEPQSAALSAAP